MHRRWSWKSGWQIILQLWYLFPLFSSLEMASHQNSTSQEFMTTHKFIFSDLISARTHQKGQRAIVTVKALFLENFDNLLAGEDGAIVVSASCLPSCCAAAHFSGISTFNLPWPFCPQPGHLGHSATQRRLDCKMAILFFYMTLPKFP